MAFVFFAMYVLRYAMLQAPGVLDYSCQNMLKRVLKSFTVCFLTNVPLQFTFTSWI